VKTAIPVLAILRSIKPVIIAHFEPPALRAHPCEGPRKFLGTLVHLTVPKASVGGGY